MKHENLFKIYIPEPCHEDWNKMTPNQQGAYCKVCAKTVVDFSNKSDKEIEKFLLDNLDNKVCGRFRVNQLADNKELHAGKNRLQFPGYLQPVMTPFKATALAMMLFGSVMMHGCGNSSGAGGDDVKLTGAVVLVDSTNQYDDNNKIQGGVTVDRDRNNKTETTDSTCNVNDDTRTVGKLRIVPKSDTLKTDTTETMIKGEIEPVKKLQGLLMLEENTK